MTEGELRDEVNKQLGEINELKEKIDSLERTTISMHDANLTALANMSSKHDRQILKRDIIIEWLEERMCRYE